MKAKVFTFMCLSLSSNVVFSQLKVSSNGNTGFGLSTGETAQAQVSVGCEGRSDSKISAKGKEYVIYAYREGMANNWGPTINGVSPVGTANFSVGVRGEAYSESPFPSYRSFGVMGLAGNATSGWNYGVFGRLKGENNGAAIFGTVSDTGNGVNTGGRYAGYFSGATKVAGNLTVTGYINGVILGPSSTSANSANAKTGTNLPGKENDILEKVGCLSMVPYYMPKTVRAAEAYVSDTADVVKPLTGIEKQRAEKVHYGLSAEQLKAVFPDLVYENEDGTDAINYMELVPILVQTINELNDRISALEGKSTFAERRSGGMVTSETNTIDVDEATAIIDLNIDEASKNVDVTVYDLNGILVKKININARDHGRVYINLQDEGLVSGCYICTMTVDGRAISTKRIAIDK